MLMLKSESNLLRFDLVLNFPGNCKVFLGSVYEACLGYLCFGTV